MISTEFDRRFFENKDIMAVAHAFQKEHADFLNGEVLKPLIDKYCSFLNDDLLEKQLLIDRRSIISVVGIADCRTCN